MSNRRKIKPLSDVKQYLGFCWTARRALKHPTSSKLMRDPKFRNELKRRA